VSAEVDVDLRIERVARKRNEDESRLGGVAILAAQRTMRGRSSRQVTSSARPVYPAVKPFARRKQESASS
jgi:hypothetical protein